MDLERHITKYADAPKDWEPTWVVEHMIQFGGVNFLVGPPKQARKSSLRRYLTVCAMTGERPFGAFKIKRRVEHALVMIMEDHPGMERKTMDKMFNALGHSNTPAIDFLSPTYFHLNHPGHRESLLRLIEHEGYDLITIDPLIEFHSADENSAAEIVNVAIALHELAQRAGVFVCHHRAKPPSEGGFSGRTIGEKMRGSGVLGGMASVTIESLPKGKNRVRLGFETKLSDSPDPLEVEFDPATWLWDEAQKLTEALVLQVIKADPGVTREELVGQLRRSRKQTLALVKTLIDNGLVHEQKPHHHQPGQLHAV